MQDRVALVGGTVTVESAPGVGVDRSREAARPPPRGRRDRPERACSGGVRRGHAGRLGRDAHDRVMPGRVVADQRPAGRAGEWGFRLDREPGGLMLELVVALGQVRREPAARDLARRPPECSRGRKPAGWSSPPLTSARMNRGCPPVSSSPRSTGRNGRGLDRGPQSCRDRLGDRVRLLGRHAALLDRAGGRVACGVDVGPTVDQPVEVGGNEAVRIVRQAREERSAQPAANSPHARPRCSAPARRSARPSRASDGRAAAEELDPALVQQRLHGRGGRRVRRPGAVPAQGLRARAGTCAGPARWREPPSSERARRVAAAMRRRRGRQRRRAGCGARRAAQDGAEAAGIARALDRHAARNGDCGLCSDGDHQDLVGEAPGRPTSTADARPRRPTGLPRDAARLRGRARFARGRRS